MMLDVIDQFRDAMLAAGITPPPHIHVDGKKHRFSTDGSARDTAGEYRIYPDSIPAGYFLDWRTGVYHTWCHNIGRPYTPTEIKEQREATERRKQQELAKQDAAAHKALEIWNAAPVASATNAYIISKGIEPLGLRAYKDCILVPVTLDKQILSLQFIKPDGQKFFMSNGRVRGCYYSIGKPETTICICEGIATGISIHQATGHAVVVAFSCGNLAAVAEYIRSKFPEAVVLICADDDVSGLKSAKRAAELINGIIVTPVFEHDRPEKATDFNDMALLYGLELVKATIYAACVLSKSIEISSVATKIIPLPLPEPLPAVMPLNPEMLPQALRGFVMDVSDRQQSPPDFVAVTALCALSAVLGRRVLMRPKQNDDWTVTPNLWGAIIGRPSAMKSPSMKAALIPLYKLEEQFASQYSAEKKQYSIDAAFNELDQQATKKNAKDKIKDGDRNGALMELQKTTSLIPPPIRKRLIVNDTTVEKLGELLNENPNGLALVRDELFGWIAKMQREEFQAERAFYLECFDGNSRYIYDRIGRGTIEITSCTLSVIGGIQPSKISSLINRAMSGISDDGLIQRLQLAVWPDDHKNWSWIDQAPDAHALERYEQIFLDFHSLNNDDAYLPDFLHFMPEAQALFVEWMQEINSIARSGDIHPVLESHLLKLPQTIASLALIFELINGGRQAVGVTATAMALEWADYLKSHAERLYSLGLNRGIDGAHIILQRKDKLQATFKAREIKLNGWKGLGSIELVNEALQCLIDHNYLRANKTPTTDAGGRPTIEYSWVDYEGVN